MDASLSRCMPKPTALVVLAVLALLLVVGSSPECAYGAGSAVPAKGVVKSGNYLEFYNGTSANPTKKVRIQVKRNGFVVAGNMLYYFKDGSNRAVKNKKVQGIKFGESRAASDNYTTKLKIAAMKTAKKLKLYDSSVSKGERLKKAFSYCCNKSTIKYSTIYPSMDRIGMHRVGYIMLTRHRGCCYGFASAFGALAKEIGFNPSIVCFKRPGYRHGMCKIGDYYYDPSFAHHKVKNKWSVYKVPWSEETKITHYNKDQIEKEFRLYKR